MALTDAAEALTDIDAARTAPGAAPSAATWPTGSPRTDRFKAIVSHAGLWALDRRHHDDARRLPVPGADRRRYGGAQPHRDADEIRTPMLVIHGDRDYRVPVGEAPRSGPT